MALRNFYSLQEITIQPIVESLAPGYDLCEPLTSCIDKSIPYAFDGAVKFDEEPCLPTVQILALQMEQARQALLGLLLENRVTFNLLNTQLSKSFSQGVDFSALNDDSSMDKDVIQDNFFVQDEKQTSELSNPDNGNQLSAINRIHFFPASLIRIAGQYLQITNDSAANDHDRHKLLESSRLLQELRQQMIVNNTGLVAFVAYKYKTTYLSFEDLMQEGTVGLMRAVDRFNPYRGIRFSTYAIFWIKQAILRLIIKQEKGVRLPVSLAEKAGAVFEIMRSCYLENNRWPSLTELNAQCSLSLDEIKIISGYYQATHSLDAAIFEDNDDQTLMDTLIQQQYALPLNDLIDKNLSQYLGNVVASLPEKEAAILNMRFGLKNHTEMTLQAIADQLHVTRERVRQIQNQALDKLKQQFGCDLLPFLEPNDG